MHQQTLHKTCIGLIVCAITVLWSGVAQAQIENDLDAALANWNANYSANVMAIAWTEIAPISTPADRDATIAALTDPTSTYITAGDPFDPSSITAALLGAGTLRDISEWTETVEANVVIGQRRFIIDWQFMDTGDAFTTTTVGTAAGIDFGSMLSTIVVPQIIETASGGVDILWIWGSVRGEIRWSVTCVSDGQGGIICEHDCSAWMALGDAQIECHTEKQGNCCILHYGWAWRTPTGSIRIVWNPETGEFEITVTGIGSSGKGDGSISDCCASKCTLTMQNTNSVIRGGSDHQLVADGAAAGSNVSFYYSAARGNSTLVKPCVVELGLDQPTFMGSSKAGDDGRASMKTQVVKVGVGVDVFFQAVDEKACCASPVLEARIE
ncbi:MAG: hypothetical protein ACF8PN_15180 [Phycisphaerales bacterium]